MAVLQTRMSSALRKPVHSRSHAICTLRFGQQRSKQVAVDFRTCVASIEPIASQTSDSQALTGAPAKALARNLVIAVDHTEDSFAAVKWTLDNLYKPGDSLHLLHVIPRPFVATPFPTTMLPLTSEDAVAEAQEVEGHMREYIAQVYMGLAGVHNANMVISVVHGKCKDSIGQVICKHSEDLAAAVVVMTAHKKNLMEQLVLGSVSKHVAAHCKRPTILLHARI